MPSIILIAAAVAVGAALLGSAALQYQEVAQKALLSPLQESCQRIADEAYKIQLLYPDAGTLPKDEADRMMYLDGRWLSECVAVLPAESIIEIAENADRDTRRN